MQGIRGAITVENDNREEIIEAVKQLLTNILEANNITTEDIGAALFSATKDITSVFPAFAARQLPNWDLVPLFDAQQLYIENSMEKCIRVLLFVNTDKSQKEIKHIYLGRASQLRPDIKKD
ncbi:chorismate mutase [uncultured Megamonas sp.]|uniref:chorismate mutase n=1 Tax=uncultured Megamonas sp. TaxID=286140 RepID=UPI0025EDB94F|nr:chorismate mutase [uncultured Megamonas sp.]